MNLNIFFLKFEYSEELSRHAGKFPDTMECFRPLWKVLEHSGMFPDYLQFSDTLEKFCTFFWKLRKVSGPSKNFFGYF